jgi:hypothetical protein
MKIQDFRIITNKVMITIILVATIVEELLFLNNNLLPHKSTVLLICKTE